MFDNNKKTTIFYLILSFILGLCIFFCSVFSTLKFTVFSPWFLSDTVNSTNYYKDLCEEITDDLINIGDASGLDKSFFNDFVDELLVRKDVQDYIDKFYAGEQLKVDSKGFQKNLRAALDKYINRKGIARNSFSESAVNGFVKEATRIYVSDIEITYFSQIQKSYLKYNNRLNILIAVTAAVIIGIVLLFIFTNKWKHIAVRYIYYAVASAGLLTFLISAIVFLSGITSKIAIISRSLNDLYSTAINSLISTFLCIGFILLAAGAFLWILHNNMRKKVSN